MARKPTLLSEPKYERQCAWNDHGYRCQSDGHISDSVIGGGPWYCRDHWSDLKGHQRYTPRPSLDMSQEAVDERVNDIVPRLDGESEHDWSMRCKDYVLARIKNIRFRTPDDLDATA